MTAILTNVDIVSVTSQTSIAILGGGAPIEAHALTGCTLVFTNESAAPLGYAYVVDNGAIDESSHITVTLASHTGTIIAGAGTTASVYAPLSGNATVAAYASGKEPVLNATAGRTLAVDTSHNAQIDTLAISQDVWQRDDAQAGWPLDTSPGDYIQNTLTPQRAAKLDRLDANITSRAAPGNAMALTDPAVGQIGDTLEAELEDAVLHFTPETITELADGVAAQLDIASALDEIGNLYAGALIVPVNQVPVPLHRTWTIKQSGDGMKGELALIRSVGEHQLFAVDFRNDLAANGRLVSLDDVSIVSGDESGLVISELENDRGVDRSQAKFKIHIITPGTYGISCRVTYDDSDGGGTSVGTVTLIGKEGA